jgi:glucose/arabinose dehydrogenase
MQAAQPVQLDSKKIRFQLFLMGLLVLIGAILGAFLVASGVLPSQYNLELGAAVPEVEPPENFEITVFAMDLAAPRFMVAHPEANVVFVSERGAGRILALQDADEDGIADDPIVVVDGLSNPSGLAFHDGWLYVAQTSQVIRLPIDESFHGGQSETIIDDLPVGKNNNEVESNQYALLIDGEDLYVSVGASCAACEESDSRRATVLVYNLDGSNERGFSRGLYQTLALVENPLLHEVWAGVQGRPEMDEAVPESLYRLQNGEDAGWPNCHAGTIPDPNAQSTEPCENALHPLLTLEPQANLTGLLFAQANTWPADYQGDLLIALHGGVLPDGEQTAFGVYRLEIDPATGDIASSGIEDFITGFRLSEEPGDLIGRPFQLALTPDGSLYITDDAAGAVYRLRYIP